MRFSVRVCAGPLLSVCLALGAAWPAAAQRLPEGAYNAVRERSYDLQHLAAALSFDFEAGRVAGTATLDLAPLHPLTEVVLDALHLEVGSVTLVDRSAGDVPLQFEADGRSLRVRLPETAPRGAALRLRVAYAAKPRAGMYFQRDPANPRLFLVATYGEGGLHANWLPLYGDVNDKLTTEMSVTVPAPYTVISNGELVSRRRRAGGTTFHWRQERPHSSYLITLYVGDFVRGELPSAGPVSLAYWVPRGRLEEGAYAFRSTPAMVEYFGRRFGYPYPWNRYDQVAVPDYMVGAMEHTGATGHLASVLRLADAPADFGPPTFDEYWTDWSAEATISHELAHHWFGNTTTCRNLRYLWLNESFASYLMMLWDEESVSRDQLDFDVELARRHYFAYVDTQHIIRPLEYAYFDSPDDIFNTEHTYLKGAAVLHMLRSVLGDEAYFSSLSRFLHAHDFENVESHDLERALEEGSGRDLDWFFAQWVTGGGHPVFEVRSRYLENRRVVDLSVAQVQPLVEGQGIFRLPVEVTIATPSKTWKQTVWVDEAEEAFLLPAEEEPLMVSFDGGGHLVAEIHFAKEPDELVYQAAHDALPGRLRALGGLAYGFPASGATLGAFADTLAGDAFWALKAEAAQLLGELRTPAALELATEALRAPDYRVRKAAVLGLTGFGRVAEETLREVVANDRHNDVVSTAIVALARIDPQLETDFLVERLGRASWYDEVRIAVMQAFEELARKDAVPVVKPYAAAPYNQDLRERALAAWEAASPHDPELHATLLSVAGETPYGLQKYAIEALGRLAVEAAVPFLEDLAQAGVDPNLTQLSENALEEIRRIASAEGDSGEREP